MGSDGVCNLCAFGENGQASMSMRTRVEQFSEEQLKVMKELENHRIIQENAVMVLNLTRKGVNTMKYILKMTTVHFTAAEFPQGSGIFNMRVRFNIRENAMQFVVAIQQHDQQAFFQCKTYCLQFIQWGKCDIPRCAKLHQLQRDRRLVIESPAEMKYFENKHKQLTSDSSIYTLIDKFPLNVGICMGIFEKFQYKKKQNTDQQVLQYSDPVKLIEPQQQEPEPTAEDHDTDALVQFIIDNLLD